MQPPPRHPLDDVDFAALLRARRRLRVGLSGALLLGYFGLIVMAGAVPDLFGMLLFGRLALGLLATLVLIAMTVALTSFYVWWSRTRLDPHVDRLVRRSPL